MSQDGVNFLACGVSSVDPTTAFHLKANCVRNKQDKEVKLKCEQFGDTSLVGREAMSTGR